ncbi:MAG: putative alpha/beta hydrolase [Myxococcaceae bacterium]|nr:putative alpha/beta hydrolase [Myxococcaceae bacterium]
MSKPLKSMQGVVGLVGAFGIGTALGWVALRKLAANVVKREAAPSIYAPRETIDLMSSGTMTVYADRRGSGRPLVLFHGVHPGASAAEVKSIFSAYRAKRPVFAPDLPGFGASNRHDHLYSAALYTFAMMQLLVRLTTRELPADVVAYGLSSEFAARAARDRPDLFNSLTLVAPTGFATAETRRGPRDLFTPHDADMVYAKVVVPTLVLHGRSESSFARLEPFLARHARTWRARRLTANGGVPEFEVRGEMFHAVEDLWSDIAHAHGPVERVSHNGFPHVALQLR